ncbi:MAG TPA: ChbG/HpnK family deacetylase [Patescibacteria group bacterium]|nr:ChbG/HpnK family deacetylase [Patescibacteria group bacterium]
MSNELTRVILNGDDFGFSSGVNRGILDSIHKGVLTSTSVMVNRPAASEAKVLSRMKDISVGLHLDLTEEGIQRWTKILYILTWPEKKIREEFEKQIDKFQSIVGKLPDHIDSHHHVHWLTGFKKVVLEFSEKNNIPVRCVDATFEMGFYGRSLSKWNDLSGVTPERLINVIEKLPPGVHEIMCHPGFVDQGLRKTGTTYLSQRENEVKALTSPKVTEFLIKNKNIELINWKEINK